MRKYSITSPSHDKSTADGVGGTIKSLCDRAVTNGKDVTSAQRMINIAESIKSKVKMFLISEDDINKIDLLVNANIKSVPNTKKVFQLIWTKEETKILKLNYLTCSYCVVNGFYYPSCNHFSLQPNSWSVELNTKQKKEP